MGIKNIKERFNIEHQICLSKGDICIGSPYISDIIRISADGKFIKRYSESSSWTPNADLCRYESEIDAAIKSGEFLELLKTPDQFEKLFPVYTIDERKGVIKKYCEEFGYPNTTIDGEKMYENTFFKTKDEARKYLQSETRLAVKQSLRFWKERLKRFNEINLMLISDLWNYLKARCISKVREEK